MSKIVNISEDKFRHALREIFKEEVLNGPNPNNQNPLDPPDDDGTLNHDVGTVGEFDSETLDKNEYGI